MQPGQDDDDDNAATAREEGAMEEEGQPQEEDEEDEGEAMEIMEEDEDEDEEEFEFRAPLRPPIPGCELTQLEEDWAWELARRVEGRLAGVENMTDFEYVVFGLHAEGDIEKALHSARGLDIFRQTYNVQDTVEECVSTIQQFIQLQPRALLHVDQLTDKGEGMCVFNQAAVIPAPALESDSKWRVHVMTYYYLLTIQHPDFRSCREGIYNLVEGKGMSWENYNQEYESRLHAEIWAYYPSKVKRLMVYNTNPVVATAWGLLKRLLPQQYRNVLQLGCQIEWDSNPDNPKLALTDLYLLPTYESAMEHVLQRVRSLAELRYHNQEAFQL